MKECRREKKNENQILLTQILMISNEALTAMWMRQMYAYIKKEKKSQTGQVKYLLKEFMLRWEEYKLLCN